MRTKKVEYHCSKECVTKTPIKPTICVCILFALMFILNHYDKFRNTQAACVKEVIFLSFIVLNIIHKMKIVYTCILWDAQVYK